MLYPLEDGSSKSRRAAAANMAFLEE